MGFGVVPRRAGRLALLLVTVLGVAACEDGPTQVEFQVIEEVDFASSLGVDLGSMTRLPSGVYVQDLVTGGGEPAVFGTRVTIDFRIWLVDGTLVADGSDDFFMGNSQVIVGLEDALLNMLVGSTRLAVIPPGRAFGGLDQVDSSGNVTIPGGSVLVYEIELLEVVEP